MASACAYVGHQFWWLRWIRWKPREV